MAKTLTKQREEDLFEEARRLASASEQRAFMERECAGDALLRRRVEELLEAAAEADAFFDDGLAAVAAVERPLLFSPLEGATAPYACSPGEEPLGTKIGNYKLIEKIGEGGCGVVYLAEQEQPVRRRVALKIIKLGMETKSIVARFEAERQALALMDHPNIARVFDAGATERGSPYFIMELVRGVQITKYCAQHHLGLRKRLDLFVQVCHAIQHAHQKGIIHGDIKPSNIMIALHDGNAVPKVIDFGISKVTETRLGFAEKTPLFGSAQLVGTPTYMSPEQAEMGGVDIDTRSDIYSLGVLFYELLADRTPFDSKELHARGLDHMRDILREQKPARPSEKLAMLSREDLRAVADNRRCKPAKLLALLRSDLDWIACKALEKERASRYETANGLAIDVERFLSNEPVRARPQTWSYRLMKLVRRNRVVFIAGGAVAAALVVGMGTSTWLFLKERETRERAVEAEQQQARLRHEAESREKITQAALLVSQERFKEVDGLLGAMALTQPTMEGAAVLRAAGEWHALQNHWNEAAERFSLLLHVNQLEALDMATMDYLRCGPALIESSDATAYEKFRQQAIERFSTAPCAFADRIVKISLLRPANPQLLETLTRLSQTTAEGIASAAKSGDTFTAAWRSLAMGLLEYRRGNYAVAMQLSLRCLTCPEPNAPRVATARLVLAMTYFQMSRRPEATQELSEARALLDGKGRAPQERGSPTQGFWFDWAFAQVLLKEAKALMDAQL